MLGDIPIVVKSIKIISNCYVLISRFDFCSISRLFDLIIALIQVIEFDLRSIFIFSIRFFEFENSKTAPKLLWNCSEIALKLFKNCSETAPELP